MRKLLERQKGFVKGIRHRLRALLVPASFRVDRGANALQFQPVEVGAIMTEEQQKEFNELAESFSEAHDKMMAALIVPPMLASAVGVLRRRSTLVCRKRRRLTSCSVKFLRYPTNTRR